MTTDSDPVASTPTARDYYSTLYQVATTIASSLELEQVLQSIVKSVTEAMDVKGAVVRLLDPESGDLHVSAVYGLSPSYLSKGPVSVTRSPIDHEALNNEPVFIPDVRVDERFQYREAAEHEGLVSVLCVPLEVRGSAIGVMRVYTAEITTFDDDDIKFMSVLASLAAQAIENARLYAALKQSYSSVIDAFWGIEVTTLDA